MMLKKYHKLLTAIVLTAAFPAIQSAHSAPGEISELPLFLGNSVKPNVLFVLDDSGSMDNEVLQRPSANNVLNENNPKSGTGYNNGNLDMTPSSLREYREHCIGYNMTAFDPSETYEPWLGHTNIDVSVANPQADSYPMGFDRDNNVSTQYGFDGGNGGDRPRGRAKFALNNNNVGYLPWNDADNDGEYDFGECSDTNLSSAQAAFISFPSMDADTKQKYANWYSYYRKRRFVLIKPMLEVLEDYDIRAGLASINNMSDSGFPMSDLAAGTNRDTAQNTVLELGGNRIFTPLRRPLINAGRYFSGQSVDYGFVGATTSPVDPILPAADGGACQANYTMLMTDGFSFENDSSGSANRLPESSDLTTIGNADGDNSSSFDGGLYADTYSGTLGDIAMHYYEGDLKPNDAAFPDNVLSNNPLDTNSAQHMVTYTVAFGVEGNLSGFPATTADVNWPVANNVNFWDGQKRASLDDLLHASYNGRGLHLSALNSQELSDGLSTILDDIVDATKGSAASVGFNSTNISSGSVLYQSRFFAGNWNGSLNAFRLSDAGILVCPGDATLSCPMVVGDASTCNKACVNGSPIFDAGDLLKNRLSASGHTSRQIITHNGTQGVPFQFPADVTSIQSNELSSAQVNDLLVSVGANDPQAFGESIVAFLRGDNSQADGVTFRDRGGFVLGDIAHSSPFVVSPPSASYPDNIEAESYLGFVDLNKNRKKLVYVGANDGMLHSFDAETGEEVFSYIPSMLFSTDPMAGLHWLADPTYSRRPYVDATPTSADVFDGSAWRTYLAGGLGAGGKGIYVLDVTNPSNLSENYANNMVVLEFTDNNLGYTFSSPRMAKLNNGKWAVVFGNGYGADSGDGRAKLFIVYLDGSGSVVLDTGVGSINASNCLDTTSDCNGLSSPTLVDLDGDAVLDRVYAGDLHGNMWAFDLSSNNPNSWAIAHEDNSTSPAPLFTACRSTSSPCPANDRQPITTQPEVVAHGTEAGASTRPNIMVLFGTGQYLTQADISDSSVQSFYGVWDAGTRQGELRRAQLVEQVFSVSAGTGTRSLSQNNVDYSTATGGKHGWFIDLPASRERSVIEPIAVGEIVLFGTSIPDSSPCASGGTGYLVAAEIFSGGRPQFSVFSDPDQSAIFIDALVVGTATIDDKVIVSDSLGGIPSEDYTSSRELRPRRTGWSIIR